MQRAYDVIVVGAGPAGSAAAAACAKAGLRTLCVEEHGTIGSPVQCAGLLSVAAFEECRVSERCVENRVSGAKVISGSGTTLTIDAKKTKAVVVDRGILDREMAGQAADAGADFRLKTGLVTVRDNRILTRGAYGHEEFTFRMLIAADGPRSTIARLYRMERAKTFLAGIQCDIRGECDPRLVEIYPDASPEFFGWSIPTGPGRIRVGLCGGTQVAERFRAFMKKFGPTTTTSLVTGTLPLGLMPKTYGRRTLFVGDAAGFAKPTSGGGIYTGVRSARHAAEVAAEACMAGMYTDDLLARYESRWREDFGHELDAGYALFAMRQKLTTEDMDALLTAMQDPEIVRTIEEYGDMDRPKMLVKKLLMKPAVLRLIGPLVRTGMRAFL
ncbi:MAG: NAD(P)/FAD-dependent oxidoreductase [Methanomicrobiales archaeon]|nr:NAD(P)/FAD-dependent oxidoreductase [Methanomicrobiales archaeon]